MMRRLLLALSLLLSFAAHAGAANVLLATRHIAPLIACPFGNAFPDGCPSAPAPLTAPFFQPNGFQPGGYINQIAATSANYMNTNCGVSANLPCRPQWNVAGFDYAIGNYTPALPICTKTTWDGTCLLDPAMVGSSITMPGCSYSLTLSGTGDGLLICGNSGFLGTIAHFNFGPVNGHNCTALRLNGGGAESTYFIDDISFFNDDGKCAELVNQNPIWFLTPLITQNLVVTNVFADGNARTFSDQEGGCSGTTQCNPGVAWDFDIEGTLSVQYVAAVNFAGRSLNMPATGAGVTMTDSYVEGWLAKALWGHGEWYLGGGAGQGTPTLTLSYMMAVDRWDVQQQGFVPIFPATNFPNTIGALSVDHFVNINSSVGKASKTGTFQGCIGATFSGGVCVGAGNVFFVTSLTGTIGYGIGIGAYATVPNCNTNFAVYYFATDLGSGPGYLDSWTIDSGTTPARLISVGPFNGCPVNAFNNAIAAIGFFGGGGAPLGTSTFNNNYIDVASIAGAPATPNIYSTGNAAGPTTQEVRGIVSGANLVASGSATLASGELMYAADIAACSNALSCPSVTTGFSPQNTGASSTATTCVANSPITGQHAVTVVVATAHNLLPQETFTLAGFTGTGNTAYNGTYTAITGTTAGTLVGEATGATCPANSPATAEGNVSYAASAFTLSSSASVGPETLEGFINDASFNATISGTAMTTTTSQTLTVGDFVYGAATCGADPSSCPKIASGSGTAWVLSATGGTVGTPTAMNTLAKADSFNGTINNASPGALASGNQLLPSIGLILQSSVNAPDVTGCSSGVLGCPVLTMPGTTTSQTQTSFTLSASGGTAGPEVIALVQQNFCNTLTDFHDNIDMTASLTDPTVVNRWSQDTVTIGCH